MVGISSGIGKEESRYVEKGDDDFRNCHQEYVTRSPRPQIPTTVAEKITPDRSELQCFLDRRFIPPGRRQRGSRSWRDHRPGGQAITALEQEKGGVLCCPLATSVAQPPYQTGV